MKFGSIIAYPSIIISIFFNVKNFSVTVGATALPTILKMATIMKEKKNEWSQQDELPVSFQYG